MTIDTSGKWWVGDAPGDIEEYLKELKVEGHEVNRYSQSRCTCGGETFKLRIDADNEAAIRTCAACSSDVPIGDSAKYFQESTQAYVCVECQSETCNIGVSFSLYEPESNDIRWVSIGVRCTRCGVLGCIVDWKVGGGNDADYFNRA